MYLELNQELKESLPEGEDAFDWFLRPKGTTHREVKNRHTYEARLGDLHFYVKRHLMLTAFQSSLVIPNFVILSCYLLFSFHIATLLI